MPVLPSFGGAHPPDLFQWCLLIAHHQLCPHFVWQLLQLLQLQLLPQLLLVLVPVQELEQLEPELLALVQPVPGQPGQPGQLGFELALVLVPLTLLLRHFETALVPVPVHALVTELASEPWLQRAVSQPSVGADGVAVGSAAVAAVAPLQLAELPSAAHMLAELHMLELAPAASAVDAVDVVGVVEVVEVVEAVEVVEVGEVGVVAASALEFGLVSGQKLELVLVQTVLQPSEVGPVQEPDLASGLGNRHSLGAVPELESSEGCSEALEDLGFLEYFEVLPARSVRVMMLQLAQSSEDQPVGILVGTWLAMIATPSAPALGPHHQQLELHQELAQTQGPGLQTAVVADLLERLVAKLPLEVLEQLAWQHLELLGVLQTAKPPVHSGQLLGLKM